MRIAITGAAGFVGNYLIRELRYKSVGEDEIIGLEQAEFTKEALELLDGSWKVDITEIGSLEKVLKEIKPDIIYHLAALSSVALSLKDPFKYFYVNQLGTLNLLEVAVNALDKHPLMLIVGSADIYNVSEDGKPITEETSFNPLNPYAVSKAGADFLAEIYWKNHGLKTIRSRSFNHIGPGQLANFALPNFAKQIARIERGLQEPVIMVGNLEARRDFTDVRDVVKAYRLIVENGTPGEVYNVCSKRGYTVGEALDMLLDLSQVDIDIERDPERMRPSDKPVLIGDNNKIKRDTGWQPEIRIEKTLEELLNFWRLKVYNEE
ncbi:GDP-mannose 4,6-dehydratase [candidate division KSB1 bacterium]